MERAVSAAVSSNDPRDTLFAVHADGDSTVEDPHTSFAEVDFVFASRIVQWQLGPLATFSR